MILNPTQKQLWFGTREHMRWIPMPRYDTDISGMGWNTQAQYLDGRSFVRRSTTSHREYQFSWNLASRAELQPIFDYAAELYGPGPYYFIDPFAADTNVLPEWWAAPGMARQDAPILVGESRPQSIANSDFSYEYPSRGAAYTVDTGLNRQTLFVPIPPGMTFWIGAHGPESFGAYVSVKPFTGSTAGSSVNLTNIPVSSPIRCNQHFSSADGYTGVEISLQGTGTLQLFGIIGQILKNLVLPAPPTGGYEYGELPYGDGLYGGTTAPAPFDPDLHPLPGAFIGGNGHSGVEFATHPSRQGYSSALDKIGSAATLIEIGGD